MDWMDELEGRVREAASQLNSLRQENATLARRVRDLEAAAEQLGDGDGAWEKERADVRRRVEKLVAGLEKLLAE